jgi:hypothetical protein
MKQISAPPPEGEPIHRRGRHRIIANRNVMQCQHQGYFPLSAHIYPACRVILST